MIKKVKGFCLSSYRSDKTAFYLDAISFFITVYASTLMALTADNPNLVLIYPLFLAGSILSMFSYFRRKLLWPMVLTVYFSIINVVGFVVAL